MVFGFLDRADVDRRNCNDHHGGMVMNFDLYETEELASYFSDYHKDAYGYRPRMVDHTDRMAVIRGIKGLDEYMAWMKSTPEGLAQLREEGWQV